MVIQIAVRPAQWANGGEYNRASVAQDEHSRASVARVGERSFAIVAPANSASELAALARRCWRR